MGKRLQPRLLSYAPTGEWRNGKVGEGQGSEPRHPGGAWAFVDPWVRVHSLCFGVGLGSAVVAVVGHLLDVG